MIIGDFCKLLFNVIVSLLFLKLIFSYLIVEPHYFQPDLVPNAERLNFLNVPKDFSSQLEFILVPLILLFLLLYYKWFKPASFVLIIFLFSILLTITSSFLNETSFFGGIKYSLKIFSPIFLFCVLLIYSKKRNTNLKSLFKYVFVGCILLSLIAVIFFDPSMNRLENYLPIYYSNVHTNSYIVTICLMATNYQIFKKFHPFYLLFGICISFSLLFFGYGVRTSLIMFLLFSIPLLALASNEFKKIFFQIVFLLPFFLMIFLIVYFNTINWEEFSSGRISMYLEKFNLISNFNVMEFLVGKGSGSDLIKTDAWWWTEKGSHSDLITIIFENGLLYLIIMCLIILQILLIKRKLSWLYITAFIGYIFSSIISNGLAVRPLAGYVFFIFLAYLLLDSNNKFHLNIPK